MSDAGFDSSLILEAFRFETRLDRLDGEDVWFQPNGISWQWTQPAWSMPAAGRTPRAGLAPLAFPDGDLWGLRLLAMSRPGEEEQDFLRLLEDLRRQAVRGLEFAPRGPEDLARLAPLGLKLLALAGRRGFGAEGFRRLAELPTLTHLILQAPPTADALEAIAQLPNLRMLALLGGALGDEEIRRLGRLDRLEILAIPEGSPGDPGLLALAGLPLRSLSLSGAPKSTGKGFEALAERGTLRDLELGFGGLSEAAVPSLSKLRSLEYLELNGQSWREDGTASSLRALTGLQALGLSWLPVASLEWLGELPALKRLSIHSCYLRGGLKGIERVRALRELSLPDVPVEDEQLRPLAELKNLRALDLKSARMSGRGLLHLQGLPRLTHLNLFNLVSIDDAGIDALVRLPALEELNLGSCVMPYEDEQTCGLTERAAARLSELRTLRRLGIAGNRVGPRTTAGLRERLPGCLLETGSMVRSEIVEACNEGGDAASSGDLDAALAAYDRALAKDPDYPPALLGRARTLEKSGDLEGALEAADRAAEIDREAESYQVRGMLRAKAGRSAEAIDDFTRGLASDPRRVELYIWRAEAKLDLKDHSGAIDDYTRWLERCGGPDKQEAQWVGWLGQVLVNRAYARLESGDPAGAEADSAVMVALAPDDVHALMNRAEARAKLGRKAEAKQDYEAVLKLEPGNSEAKRLMGEL